MIKGQLFCYYMLLIWKNKLPHYHSNNVCDIRHIEKMSEDWGNLYCKVKARV